MLVIIQISFDLLVGIPLKIDEAREGLMVRTHVRRVGIAELVIGLTRRVRLEGSALQVLQSRKEIVLGVHDMERSNGLGQYEAV